MGEYGPFILSGVVSGLIAWAASRVEIRWLRRDVDGLRFSVHSPKNPKNLLTVSQDHENRLHLLERKD